MHPIEVYSYHNDARHLFHLSCQRTFSRNRHILQQVQSVSVLPSIDEALMELASIASSPVALSVIFLAANIKQSEQY